MVTVHGLSKRTNCGSVEDISIAEQIGYRSFALLNVFAAVLMNLQDGKQVKQRLRFTGEEWAPRPLSFRAVEIPNVLALFLY